MINWRNGKAGFVGGLKYIIKGVFQFAHSITSATPPSVDAPLTSFAVSSLISSDGSGIRSNIGSTLGIESAISSDGLGVRSNMSNAGLGLENGF